MNKKIVSMILVIITFIGMTWDVKADSKVLYKDLETLRIVQGSNTNDLLRLEDNLTRIEGLTFVIRLLGEEPNVYTQKSYFSDQAKLYDDYKENYWGNKYIGFGQNTKLIDQPLDNQFNPTHFLTEYDLYSFILNGLNITYEWNSIEQTAYEHGLIQSNDDSNDVWMTRKDAFHIFGNMLKHNTYLLDQLIRSNSAINSMNDLSYFKQFDPETKILNIEMVSPMQTVITLNEPVDSLQLDINDLKINHYSIDHNVITIDHQEALAPKNYKLNIHYITDENGNTDVNLSKTYPGVNAPNVQSKHFKISSIKSVNTKEIEIEYTQPVNESALNPSYYSIYKDNELLLEGSFDSIKTAPCYLNNKVVKLRLLSETLVPNENYMLVIDDQVKSLYGIQFQTYRYGDIKHLFVANSKDKEDFSLKSYELLENNVIRLTYSEPTSTGGDALEHYSLKRLDTNENLNIISSGFVGIGENKQKIVDLQVKDVPSNQMLQLTIKNVSDIFNDDQIKTRLVPFSSANASDYSLALTAIDSINREHLRLTFDQPIDTLEHITFNPTIDEYRIVINDQYPHIVDIYIDDHSRMKKGDDYSLKIYSNQITTAAQIHPQNSIEEKFKASTEDLPKIEFKDAYFISKDYLLATFNQPIDIHTNIYLKPENKYDEDTTPNFQLKYTHTYPSGKTEERFIDIDQLNFITPSKAVFYFKDLNSSRDYTLLGKYIDNYTKSDQTQRFEYSID